jgi:membrane protease subunit HflK
VVVSEMTHTAGSLSIDGILSRQQQELALYVKNRSQERLDELDAGLLLLSIEFAELAPPVQVQQAFEEVNTAAINRKKEINEAMAFKEEVIPQARARARSTINNARVYLEETLASARGKSDSYTQLFSAYKESPAQIRADMLNKTREGIFSRVKDIVMLPEQSKSKTLFSAFIKGVSQGDTGYYYEGSND